MYRDLRCLLLLLLLAPCAHAGNIFDGDGNGPLGPFDWGNAANWDANTLPLFNGTENLVVVTGGVNFPQPPAGGRIMTLGAIRSMRSLDIGGVANTAGQNLTINSAAQSIILTGTTSSTASPQLRLQSSDNAGLIFNNNFLLDAGAAGSYTAFWRQQVNAGFDNEFNGAITQGAGAKLDH